MRRFLTSSSLLRRHFCTKGRCKPRLNLYRCLLILTCIFAILCAMVFFRWASVTNSFRKFQLNYSTELAAHENILLDRKSVFQNRTRSVHKNSVISIADHFDVANKVFTTRRTTKLLDSKKFPEHNSAAYEDDTIRNLFSDFDYRLQSKNNIHRHL